MHLYLTVDLWLQRVGGKVFRRVYGDKVEVSEKVGAWLLSTGAATTKKPDATIIDHGDNAIVHDDSQEDNHTDNDGATSDKADVAPAATPADNKSTIKFPARAANKGVWVDFAKKHKVDISDLKTKEDIIAHVRSVLDAD